MKNMHFMLIAFLVLPLVFSPFQSKEDNTSSDSLPFEVNKVFSYINITTDEIKESKTLEDIDKLYRPSWVKEYKSVEVTTIHKGKAKTALSKNDVLTKAQKNNMLKADIGSETTIKVLYLPNNNLKNNDVKEINISFTPDPENGAQFSGGEKALSAYLQKKAIDKIPSNQFKGYDLAAVKFSIDKNGKVVDAKILEPSKDKKTDQLLLKTIKNMPKWQPAKYTDGTKTQQSFVLTVGNMENCMVNTFNIRRLPKE